MRDNEGERRLQIAKEATIMEKLEKVELIREKCGVSYEDAKAALDACGDDTLDAIIWLEKQGKTAKQATNYTTEAQTQSGISSEMEAAQTAYQESSKKSDFSQHMDSLWDNCKKLLHKGIETKFIVMRYDEQFMSMPILVPIAGLFLWGASIWLLIIGLFFDLRYHIKGAHPVTVDVNEAMDTVADAAETIKHDVTKGK